MTRSGLNRRETCCGSQSRAPKKRRRAAALQDAARGTMVSAGAKRLGVRQSSGAWFETAVELELASGLDGGLAGARASARFTVAVPVRFERVWRCGG